MLGRSYESQVCSIARALEVFGERWTFLILRNAAFAGSVRFVGPGILAIYTTR
jgi:DNA-binding HxlR family transcriptional regulator